MANEITTKLSVEYDPSTSAQKELDFLLDASIDQTGDDSASGTGQATTTAGQLDIPSYTGVGTLILLNLSPDTDITISDDSSADKVTAKASDFIKVGIANTVYAKTASSTARYQWWYIEG